MKSFDDWNRDFEQMERFAKVFVGLVVVSLVLMAALMGGCETESLESDYVPYPEDHIKQEYLRELHLSDGTLCAVFAGGGISCDWEAKR